jgi:cyclophilin family peptidyl-prolyl cis-trans isomerase
MIRLALAALLLLAGQAAAEEPAYARITTSMGAIDVELDREAAPISAQNFLDYAESGHYDRLVFHRVIPGVLIQGGGLNAALFPRATRDPIENEAGTLPNERGTIAMARQADPDSADSQWFVNLRDNPELDRTGEEYDYQAGYAVFGRVVAGMEVADAIGAVPTGPGTPESGLEGDVPIEPVTILRVDPIEADEVGTPE